MTTPRSPHDHPNRRLQLVAIEDLPYAHFPFRCAHAGRFDALLARRTTAEAGRAFFGSLSPEDIASCPRHEGDWAAIAAACEDVFARSVQCDDTELARVAASLGPVSGLWFIAMFDEPVAWFVGEEEVASGQHRICAMRAAGARSCPVDTSEEGLW